MENRDHIFKPGESGNPNGRPKGSLNRSTLAAAAVSEEREKPLIIFLGNSASDTFWQPVVKGFEQAGEDLGFDARFRAPGPKGYASAYEYTLAVEDAIASKPDGIIVADTRPEAMNDTIKEAVDMGIPVVLSNSGFGQQNIVGALAFVGLDEWMHGRVGGEELKKTGAKHTLVITLAPGLLRTPEQ